MLRSTVTASVARVGSITMLSEFRVGDKVKCIQWSIMDSDEGEVLTIRKIYQQYFFYAEEDNFEHFLGYFEKV